MTNEIKQKYSRTRSAEAVIVSVYFWVSLFGLSSILFIVSVLVFACTFWFDKNLKILHKYTCLWSAIILFLNPYWKIRITGREKIDRKATYVMISNHQSGADILVLYKLFVHFKWVAKKGLFSIPFIGWNMALNRYIAIERSQGRSKLMMMDKAEKSVREGNSVMIFPEGTRTRTGQLQTFKSGAFRLAKETRSPILPIVIQGTFYAIQKGGFIIHRNTRIRAIVLDPIPYDEFKDIELNVLTRSVHDLILARQNSEDTTVG